MTMTLLLAIDGSHYSHRMVTYIASNELLFRPEHDYVLLHALPDTGFGSPVAPEDDVLDAPAAFLLNQGFACRTLMRRGPPAVTLIDAAVDLQANLIVMGCRGHSPLTSMVLGSVTQEVLARSHVPVLVIR